MPVGCLDASGSISLNKSHCTLQEGPKSAVLPEVTLLMEKLYGDLCRTEQDSIAIVKATGVDV